MKNFNDYFTIKQAAKLLGVSPSTLRNWDATAKLKSYRHPVNEYRLYLKADLDKLLNNIHRVKHK